MKKIFILLLLGAVVGTGCVDSEGSLVLDGPLVPVGSTMDGVTVCEYNFQTGSSGADVADLYSAPLLINLQQLIDAGQFAQDPIDTRLNRFQVVVSIANRLEPSEDYSPIGFDQNQRIDQNGVILERVTIEYPDDFNPGGVAFSSLDGEQAIGGLAGTNDGNIARVALVNSANIGTGDAPGWRDVVAAATQNNPDARVPGVAELQAFGTTFGGDEVESNLLRIPFEVCLDCEQLTTPLCKPDPSAGE